ncbi:hypothetical protein R3P38DRAFT_241435 [Favolaschia claudopus]|uniref:Uncharacterized protein n=1 Tax=Favolaschia claudopus TaxID=2862362 RepID=A0AAW0CZN5_9AGAR
MSMTNFSHSMSYLSVLSSRITYLLSPFPPPPPPYFLPCYFYPRHSNLNPLSSRHKRHTYMHTYGSSFLPDLYPYPALSIASPRSAFPSLHPAASVPRSLSVKDPSAPVPRVSPATHAPDPRRIYIHPNATPPSPHYSLTPLTAPHILRVARLDVPFDNSPASPSRYATSPTHANRPQSIRMGAELKPHVRRLTWCWCHARRRRRLAGKGQASCGGGRGMRYGVDVTSRGDG